MQYRLAFRNWAQLQQGLRQQFETPLKFFHEQAILQERRQKKDETTMDYIADMTRLFDELRIDSETE